MKRLQHLLERLFHWTGRLGHQVARLRDWLGTIVAVATAGVEHLLGETAAVAGLTAAVVLFGGILWRRVSLLMATGGSTNCAKAYAVDNRLSNYMTIMAPLAPIVNANQGGNLTNANFLANLKQVSPPSSPGTAPSSYSQSFEQNDLVGPINEIIAAGGDGGWW